MSANRIAATYDYTDEQGKLLFQLVRFEPKEFRQRQPDGKGGWVWNLQGVYRVLYRLPQLLAASPERTVFLVEGEKDVHSLEALGLLATTNPMGAGKWEPVYSEWLSGRRVVILPDNDEAGEHHAGLVARALIGVAAAVFVVRLPGLPAKGDVSDWLANPANDKEALFRLLQSAVALRAPDPAPNPSTPLVHCLQDLKAQPVSWLWPGYLPCGKLVLIDGDPGQGKSLLTLDLAARLTRGDSWPDGRSSGGPGNVVLVSCEDGVEDTIVPRLIDLGARLDRIFSYQGTSIEEARSSLPCFPRDAQQLADIVRAKQARLVIIDPLMAFLAMGVNSINDQSVRQALLPLARLAEETGTAVVIVRHLNKTGGSKAVYRGSGSIGIVGTARMSYLVARDPDDADSRVLACVKSNLGLQPPSLAFQINNDQGVRLHWQGGTELSADDLVGQGIKGPNPRERAKEFLRTALSKGRCTFADLESSARLQGLTPRTLERARAEMPTIRIVREQGTSYWTMGGEDSIEDFWRRLEEKGPRK